MWPVVARCPNCGAAVDPADDECDICETAFEGFVAVPREGDLLSRERPPALDRAPLVTMLLFLFGFAIEVTSFWFLSLGLEGQPQYMGVAGVAVGALVVGGATFAALRDR